MDVKAPEFISLKLLYQNFVFAIIIYSIIKTHLVHTIMSQHWKKFVITIDWESSINYAYFSYRFMYIDKAGL